MTDFKVGDIVRFNAKANQRVSTIQIGSLGRIERVAHETDDGGIYVVRPLREGAYGGENGTLRWMADKFDKL